MKRLKYLSFMEQTASQRLKEIRVRELFSQEEFAKEIGVSLSGYQLIEQGKRDVNTKMLESLRNRFNISADWVLFGDDITESKASMDELNYMINMILKSTYLLDMLIPYYHDLLAYSVKHSYIKEDEPITKLKLEYIQKLSEQFREVEIFKNKILNQNLLASSLNVESDTIPIEDFKHFSDLVNIIYSEFSHKLEPSISKYRDDIIKDFWNLPLAKQTGNSMLFDLKVPKE